MGFMVVFLFKIGITEYIKNLHRLKFLKITNNNLKYMKNRKT